MLPTNPGRAWKAEAALRGSHATEENFRTAAALELADAIGFQHNSFKIDSCTTNHGCRAWRTDGSSGMSILQDAMKKAIGPRPRIVGCPARRPIR